MKDTNNECRHDNIDTDDLPYTIRCDECQKLCCTKCIVRDTYDLCKGCAREYRRWSAEFSDNETFLAEWVYNQRGGK